MQLNGFHEKLESDKCNGCSVRSTQHSVRMCNVRVIVCLVLTPPSLLPAADLSVTVHACTNVRDALGPAVLRACESVKIAAATCNLP